MELAANKSTPLQPVMVGSFKAAVQETAEELFSLTLLELVFFSEVGALQPEKQITIKIIKLIL